MLKIHGKLFHILCTNMAFHPYGFFHVNVYVGLGLSPVCFSALWCLRVFGLEKDLGQIVQGKVCLSSECNSRCCFSFPDWEHLNWHIVHENDFSFVWTRRCGWSDDVHSNALICACVFWWDFSWAESTNLSSHEEQSKSFLPVCRFLWLLKEFRWVKVFPHSKQWCQPSLVCVFIWDFRPGLFRNCFGQESHDINLSFMCNKTWFLSAPFLANFFGQCSQSKTFFCVLWITWCIWRRSALENCFPHSHTKDSLLCDSLKCWDSWEGFPYDFWQTSQTLSSVTSASNLILLLCPIWLNWTKIQNSKCMFKKYFHFQYYNTNWKKQHGNKMNYMN